MSDARLAAMLTTRDVALQVSYAEMMLGRDYARLAAILTGATRDAALQVSVAHFNLAEALDNDVALAKKKASDEKACTGREGDRHV